MLMSSSVSHPDGDSVVVSEATPVRRRPVCHIAAAVDGYPEGRDAAALGAVLARTTGADLMLVTVQPEPLVVLPSGMDWKSVRKQARVMLAAVRDEFAPDARLKVRTDLSVARALRRVVRDQHRDLLVVGSSPKALDGHVRIGKRTRQLLGQLECALAFAPRGMRDVSGLRLERIGVGFDGGPESQAALEVAGTIASAAGAELHVRCVVDDRALMGWGADWVGATAGAWDEIVGKEIDSLRERATVAAEQLGAKAQTATTTGRPADALRALSGEVDLLVIGSRRWGAAARVSLGSTGESVMFHASCPVLVVPRPAN
jgi:nucleotide-binding universal stress UspA family protein